MSEPTRKEIDQAKRQMKRDRQTRETYNLIKQIWGSPEAQRLAREELDNEVPPNARDPRPITRPAPSRRRPGRPPWTSQGFWSAYLKARGEAGGIRTTDAQIAEQMLITPRQLSRLIGRFGLPPE